MKELIVISGKGGTGKTSLAAAFTVLAGRCVVADCDVDAADLHLLLEPKIKQETRFMSGYVAQIDGQKCQSCAVCQSVCRFDAIRIDPDSMRYRIDPLACEGCGACTDVCPAAIIKLEERQCGRWFVSDTRVGPMVHARMDIGAENSGKLVSTVRREARKIAIEQQSDWLIVDGPPGTGCAVIASVTDADAVLVVAEASLSGQHDLRRVAKLARHFGLPLFVCVNKWDINPQISTAIETEVNGWGAEFLGTISYDRSFTLSQMECRTIVENGESTAKSETETIWALLSQKMKQKEDHHGKTTNQSY